MPYRPILARVWTLSRTHTWSHFSRQSRTAVTLRNYQEECIQSCLSAIKEGKKRMAISLATGSGKTVIFTHLIERIAASESRTQTIILVHRRELVEQAANHCRATYPQLTIEIEMGAHHATGTADVTVCSVQSLTRRLEKYDKNRMKLILIDEAHHSAAKTYLNVLEYFGAATPQSECLVIGVSATLSRQDGLKLGSALDHIVYHKDYVQMIKEHWLCPVKFTSVKQETVDLSGIKYNAAGDFDTAQLASRVNTQAANDSSVRVWLNRAKQRKSTIVFAVDIQHVTDLTNCFRAHGVDARGVTSLTDNRQRQELVRAFRATEFPVLINCGIFTEGFDMPNIDCVLLCRPTRSRGLLVQMIGRGMRLGTAKSDCHILDMTSCLDIGVVSLPSLYGLDPSELVDHELSLEDLQARAEAAHEKAVQKADQLPDTTISVIKPPTAVTYFDYDNVEDLISELNARGGRHISTLSRLNWLQIDQTKYILSLGARGHIRVTKNDDDNWIGTETRKLPAWADSILSRPKVIFDDVEDLEHAISAASSYALQYVGRSMLLKNAPWRETEASEAQKTFIGKLSKQDFSKRSLTKGQAQDFITRFKHGLKGTVEKRNREKKAQYRQDVREYKSLQSATAKALKAQTRDSRRDRIREAETITVGPIEG